MKYIYSFFGVLVMEERQDGRKVLSLGRCMLLVVFCLLIVLWNREVEDLPAGILEVFFALLTYVLGSKFAQTWAIKKSSDGGSTDGSENGNNKITS